MSCYFNSHSGLVEVWVTIDGYNQYKEIGVTKGLSEKDKEFIVKTFFPIDRVTIIEVGANNVITYEVI